MRKLLLFAATCCAYGQTCAYNTGKYPNGTVIVYRNGTILRQGADFSFKVTAGVPTITPISWAPGDQFSTVFSINVPLKLPDGTAYTSFRAWQENWTCPGTAPLAIPGVTCMLGRVTYTQLPAGATSAEITIVPVLSGDFRFDHIMLSEFSRFDGTPAPTVSMGRPGSSNSELSGAIFPLGVSNGDVSYWYASPIPPQIFGVYPVVLNFQTAQPGGFTPSNGILKWEICGYYTTPTTTTLTGLASCSGGSVSTWTDKDGVVHSMPYSCDGLFRASVSRADGSTLNLVGVDSNVSGGTWTTVK